VFRSVRTASAITIIWVAFVVIITPILATMVDPWPAILQFLPLYGYAYAAALVRIYAPDSFSAAPSLLSDAFGLAFASGLICLVLGLTILTLHPTKLAAQSGPNLQEMLLGQVSAFRRRWTRRTSLDIGDGTESEMLTGDEDVKAERRLVDAEWGKFSKEAAIVTKYLKKVFPGKGTAVDEVTFKVDTDECFGLLGPNGAGKTTLINILAGNVEASAGRAAIAGFSTATQRRQICSILGICPQFDVLWGDLTVEEHLLLYARLHGVDRALEAARTRQVAE
jgi:ABC-type multidrug transport system fused ATPase/permease subunit